MSAYGYDSRRRQRARRAAQRAEDFRQFRRWRYGLLITALVGPAIYAIVVDRIERDHGLPIVQYTSAPHPATATSHP